MNLNEYRNHMIECTAHTDQCAIALNVLHMNWPFKGQLIHTFMRGNCFCTFIKCCFGALGIYREFWHHTHSSGGTNSIKPPSIIQNILLLLLLVRLR